MAAFLPPNDASFKTVAFTEAPGYAAHYSVQKESHGAGLFACVWWPFPGLVSKLNDTIQNARSGITISLWTLTFHILFPAVKIRLSSELTWAKPKSAELQ